MNNIPIEPPAPGELARLEARFRALEQETRELRQLAETLRQSERGLKEAQRVAHVGNWELDLAGDLLTWSEETYRIFEIAPTGFGVSYAAFLQAVHPEDRERVKRAYRESVENRTTYELEHRLLMKDGRVKHIHEWCETTYDAQGRPLGSLGTVQDITERKRAAEVRQQHERLLFGLTEYLGLLLRPGDLYGEVGCRAFEAFGRALEVDRVYLFESHSGQQRVSQRLEWSHPMVSAQIDNAALQDVAWIEAGFARWKDLLLQGQVLHGHVRDFPASERALLEAQQIQSLLVVPFTVAGEFGGFMGFDSCQAERVFTRIEIELLLGAAHSMGLALERTRAERSLRGSEEQFRTLVEQSPLSIQVLAPDGTTLQVNKAWEKLWGVTLRDLAGYNLLRDRQLEALGLLPFVQAGFAGAASAFPPAEYDAALTVGKGAKRWVQARIYPVLDDRGAVRRVVLVHEDITERMRMETELRRSRERFENLFQSSPLPAGLTSVVDGRILEVNRRWLDITGFKLEEVVGRTPQEIGLYVDPGQREALMDYIRREGTVHDFEAKMRAKDGREADMLLSGQVMQMPEGPVLLVTAMDITERKQTETALRESQERYRLLVEESPDGIGIFQNDQLVFVNSTGVRILGAKTKEEVLGRKSAQIIYPDDRQTALERIRRRMAGDTTVYPAEVRYLRLDGTVIPMEVSAAPIVYQGKPAIQFIARDITDRRRAEEALQAERTLLRTLVDHLPVAAYVKDAAGRKTLVNPVEARNLGISSGAEALGKTDFDFYPQAEAERLFADDQRVVRTGCPVLNREELSTRPDGSQAWHLTSKVPLRDAAGRVTGLVGIGWDVTEHHRTEDQLRRQAAFLDAANDAIYVLALDHTVTYWNAGAERLYGCSRAEALGRQIVELARWDASAFAASHAALLQQGVWSGELKRTSRAGKEQVILCRWTLLRDEQGRPKEVLAINSDVTETRQLETQFLRAQRLEGIGALAGGIAHDLNNILAPILMTASLLRETVTSPESRAIIDTMESCAQRGADILKQLLTFARGRPGARVPLPMRHFLVEMEKIIRETFPRQIQPRVHAAKDLWLVLGDATQVHQALMNLCVNARDAMPDGGTLLLRAENHTLDAAAAAATPDARPGDYVCVSIADTGTGIAPGILDHIFDPFFTTKATGEGTGLGLATVLGIVRGHGGFVRVHSRIGEGACFELAFPATREAFSAAPATAAVPLPRGQGELILVVDDENAVRAMVQRTLESRGYRVIGAADGREALALFTRQRHEIRAVLTDMMMPVTDGPALARALHLLEPDLPVLGMTGVAEHATIKGLDSLALSALLTKPFVGEELVSALQRTLATRTESPG
jgi:PAS domain S-box-containing protein